MTFQNENENSNFSVDAINSKCNCATAPNKWSNELRVLVTTVIND
jgi:hypothetical protein